MIIGVTYGWRYEMKVFFTHFPISLEQKGSDILVKNFLGEKSMRHAKILGKTKVELGKDQIAVVGIDKEDVSQTAANIETSTRLSGKDRRVFLDGLYITGCNHGREK
jgi:large subunit ribosomal protein L6